MAAPRYTLIILYHEGQETVLGFDSLISARENLAHYAGRLDVFSITLKVEGKAA